MKSRKKEGNSLHKKINLFLPLPLGRGAPPLRLGRINSTQLNELIVFHWLLPPSFILLFFHFHSFFSSLSRCLLLSAEPLAVPPPITSQKSKRGELTSWISMGWVWFIEVKWVVDGPRALPPPLKIEIFKLRSNGLWVSRPVLLTNHLLSLHWIIFWKKKGLVCLYWFIN